MEGKNYTQVLIDGKIYTLGGSEAESYLQKAAGYVNEKIFALRKLPGFTKQSAEYQAAMIQLNMADDYFKALERAEKMEEMRDAMEKETYSLKHELVSTQMKLEAVLKDLEERQRQLEELSKKAARLEGELLAAKTVKAAAEVPAEEPEKEELKEETAFEEEEKEEPVFTQDTRQEKEVHEDGKPEQEEQVSVSGKEDMEEEELSDEELARRALQAARKAGSHRGGRR